MKSVSQVQSIVGGAVFEGRPSEGTEWHDAPTVPSPNLSFSDPVAAALASMADLGAKTSEMKRELKKAANALRKQHERQQIAAMHRRADEIEKSAWVSAVLLGCSAGATGYSATQALESKNQRFFQPTGDLLAKSSDVVARGYEASTVRVEAEEKEAEHAARADEDDAKLYEDDARAASEIVAKAMDAIRSIQQAKHAAESAAANLRG